MKSTLATIVCICFLSTLMAQTPVEVTSERQIKLRNEVEKEAALLRQRLEQENTNPVHLEFTLDTFRIEKYVEKYMSLDFTDNGMSAANYDGAHLYDSLLNKYYKKLLTVLKGEDKKILVQAQKTWITFRDSETKLVDIISKDEYSGGGTMQRLTESGKYIALIKERTITLFEHYVRATQNY